MTTLLAISNIAWDPSEDDAVARELRDLGIEGVELALTKRWPRIEDVSEDEVKRYRDYWEARGLQIVALQALLFGRPELQLFGGESSQRDLIDYMSRLFGIAKILGARSLVFGAPGNRRRGDLSEEFVEDTARSFFSELGRLAHEQGRMVSIEANPPAYGCDFLTSSDQVVELLNTLQAPGLAVHIDTGAMTLAEEPIEAAVATAAPHACHFHISEPNLVPIGTGTVDHERFASALSRTGYEGWLSIEMRSEGSNNLDRVRSAVTRSQVLYATALDRR